MKPRSRAARAPLGVLSWEHVYIVFLRSCLWVRGEASCAEGLPGKEKKSSVSTKHRSATALNIVGKSCRRGPRSTPKWLQNGSKMDPKSLPEAPREPKRNV